MENTINKPLTVALEETKMGLANVINNSGLTPILLAPILKDFYVNMEQSAIEQTKYEMAEYQKALAEAKANQNKESTEK